MDNKITFPTLLGLLFIGLKLCDKIDWSWIWVLCPFWIPIAIFLIAVASIFVVVGFIAIFQ